MCRQDLDSGCHRCTSKPLRFFFLVWPILSRRWWSIDGIIQTQWASRHGNVTRYLLDVRHFLGRLDWCCLWNDCNNNGNKTTRCRNGIIRVTITRHLNDEIRDTKLRKLFMYSLAILLTCPPHPSHADVQFLHLDEYKSIRFLIRFDRSFSFSLARI